MKIKKIYENLTLCLLVVLPINYMIFNIVLRGIPLVKYFKDMLMLIIFFFFVLSNHKFKKKDVLSAGIIFAIISVLLLKLLSSDNIGDSLYALRLYIMPLLLYLIYVMNPISKAQTYKILRVLFYLSILMSLWGIFQAFILGDEFLINLNYKGDSGRLSAGFYISGFRGIQRVTSTFPAPNLFALFCNFMIFIFLSIKNELNVSNRLYYGGLFLITTASILTFSRSAWLGLVLGFLFVFFQKRRLTAKQMGYFVGTVVLLMGIFIYVLNTNENIYNAFMLLISRTFSGSDTSLIGHQVSLDNTIDILERYPLGYHWLGFNGPRTNTGIVNYNVESSILLIGLDLGIIGMILYTVLFMSFFLRARKGRYTTALRASLISIIPLILLLPLLVEYELTSFYLTLFAIMTNLNDTVLCDNLTKSKIGECL